MRQITHILLLMLGLVPVGSSAAQLDDVRIWAAPDHTRVVLDLSDPAQYKLFSIENPDRVVIDVSNTRARGEGYLKFTGKGLVKAVRTAPRSGKNTRVVLDLHGPVTTHSFTLRPNAEYGHRLVVDVKDARPLANNGTQAAIPHDILLDDEPLNAPVTSASTASAAQRSETVASHFSPPKLKVIAIDAGHGGEDSGARGPTGLREKNVALDISRRLAKLVNAQPGMKAVLIRDGDYYIGLRERARKAREHDADLFISIHADAFRRRTAKGASVYVLSRRGASSEHARWLASRENGADLVGGVSIRDKDDTLAAVMLDLAQNAAIEASFDVGGRVLRELGQIGNVHKKEVQQAGFVVLKSPDIPSILVETAFISNAGEEKKLRSNYYKDKLAKAVLGGIQGYFSSYRPNETVASR